MVPGTAPVLVPPPPLCSQCEAISEISWPLTMPSPLASPGPAPLGFMASQFEATAAMSWPLTMPS